MGSNSHHSSPEDRGSTAAFPVLPDYRGPCLSNVVPALLGPADASDWLPAPIQQAKAVVLFLVDGMGWEQLQDRSELTPVLSAMEGGPITTVAPTTTTTALTSLVTGSAPGVTEARGGHPSDVFADWILENDLEPGVVAMGVSNSNTDGVAKMISDDRCLISASDAGAHVQMMCAAGDTTLLLTRHVRDRGDLELERAVYEITGRQAEILGFNDRGRLLPGYAGDVTVFDLDELSWDNDGFVSDLPSGAPRLRRPAGGYRATAVNGVLTQVEGSLTGANPGAVLDANTPAP